MVHVARRRAAPARRPDPRRIRSGGGPGPPDVAVAVQYAVAGRASCRRGPTSSAGSGARARRVPRGKPLSGEGRISPSGSSDGRRAGGSTSASAGSPLRPTCSRFPFDAPPGTPSPSDELGDVVLCAPVVNREARAQGKSPAATHWAHLVVHGVIHLLGYDHDTAGEAGRMEGAGAPRPRALRDPGFPTSPAMADSWRGAPRAGRSARHRRAGER